MAHYAFLDEKNIVVEVIAGIDETELIDNVTPEEWYQNWKGLRCIRTSYNGKIRKNYAGIGYFYDEKKDAFIAPKPFTSWILDAETCKWIAPVDRPDNDSDYLWSEELGDWIIA